MRWNFVSSLRRALTGMPPDLLASCPAADTGQDSFFLDSESNESGLPWVERTVGCDLRMVLPLGSQGRVESPRLALSDQSMLALTCCRLDAPLPPGSLLQVTVRTAEARHCFVAVDLSILPASGKPAALELDLSGLAGLVGFVGISLAGDAAAPVDGVLGLLEFAVTSREMLPLWQARSHRTWRLRNELQHFGSGVYEHAIYASRQRQSAGQAGTGSLVTGTAASQSGDGRLGDFPRQQIAACLEQADWARVRPGEDPYHYSHRLLGRLLPMPAPDFAQRLRAKADGRALKFLSICSGTAGVELGIIAAAGVPVEATFVDINQDLLADALRRLPPNCTGRCIVGNVNDIWPLAEKYDVVACVSGLHHIVELEVVLAGVRDSLVADGEFWSIGEQIGRNGNRLWPDALAACNAAMQSLPPDLRRNAYHGGIDDNLPERDFSSASFEGIRSQDIEACLDRFFLPISVYRRNSFLWRLVNQTYSDNYDFGCDEHVQAIRRLVLAEVEHWWKGGRPTELHGAYASRQIDGRRLSLEV